MRSTAWQDFGAGTYLRMVGLAGYKEILGTEEIVEYVHIYVYIYVYIYAQTGTFADPTVQRFELFFPFECGVSFFCISRSIFFLWFKPIKFSALLSPPATKKQRLNTGYITGLGMCKVCTEAVHSVAL